MRTPDPSLTAEQVAEAERIFHVIREATEEEQWRIAELLASKRDHQLLGETEYQVRDLVHRIGAKERKPPLGKARAEQDEKRWWTALDDSHRTE